MEHRRSNYALNETLTTNATDVVKYCVRWKDRLRILQILLRANNNVLSQSPKACKIFVDAEPQIMTKYIELSRETFTYYNLSSSLLAGPFKNKRLRCVCRQTKAIIVKCDDIKNKKT